MKINIFLTLFLLFYSTFAQFKVQKKEDLAKELKTLKPESKKGSGSTDTENSPAKGQISTFWKQIEKMRNHTNPSNKQVVFGNGIQSAQLYLSNTKTKDPNYDTTEMESALKECQTVYEGLAGSKQNLRDTRGKTMQDAEKLLTQPFVFKDAEVNIGGDKTEDRSFIEKKLLESNEVIEDYKTQLQTFIGSNPEKIMFQNNKHIVTKNVGFSEDLIKKVDDISKNYRTLAAVGVFQNLHIYKAYIEGMIKVFPQEDSYIGYLSKINEAINKYGDYSNFMNKMAANQKEFIKNLRMAKAVMNNAELERIAKQEFEKADMSSKKYTVFKVNIASNWKLEKNSLDIPLHKEVFVNMAIKFADGTCGLANGWLHQEYTGAGTYSAAVLYHPSSITELPCENLK